MLAFGLNIWLALVARHLMQWLQAKRFVENKSNYMKTLKHIMLGLLAVIAISSSAQAQTGNGWSFTLAGEYAPDVKLRFGQPGSFYGNPPHPLGLGNGEDWLDS